MTESADVQRGLRSSPVDGFQLTYDLYPAPAGTTVLALHGWPGDRRDFRDVIDGLTGKATCIAVDLRGFGDSDRHDLPPAEAYGGPDQARSVIGLMDELELDQVILTGYDIGSRIAQVIATQIPDRVAHMVITPPAPGVGKRALALPAVRELWYQTFHQLPLIESLVRGPEATRAYLEYFWNYWSAANYQPESAELDRLAAAYARPGAFRTSIGWYRSAPIAIERAAADPAPPAQRIDVPTTMLWPTDDPLMPLEWSDRLDEYFSALNLRPLPGVGHFSPLEAPEEFVAAIMAQQRL